MIERYKGFGNKHVEKLGLKQTKIGLRACIGFIAEEDITGFNQTKIGLKDWRQDQGSNREENDLIRLK